MNAPFQPATIALDQLALGTRALVASLDWDVLVEPLHLGPFGRDPMAVRVGRMTVAIRRKHARAINVLPTR